VVSFLHERMLIVKAKANKRDVLCFILFLFNF
jgi:hypothetical protein